jgi:hypothetical protein
VETEKKIGTEPKDAYVEPLLVQHGPLGELTGQKSKENGEKSFEDPIPL